MHDNLKDWFKNDYWSHGEATCLICGVIALKDRGLSFKVPSIHKVGNIEVLIKGEKINKILILFSIFESASWESNDKDGKRIWSEYIKMAERKDIKVDFALKCAKNSFEKQNSIKNKLMKQDRSSDNSDSMVTFSPKMTEVLGPIAKC
jgi:hypothetical protein